MDCWIDGQPADALPLSDRGFQYGDGVFRTMLVWQGEVVWQSEQLALLRRDAGRLDLPLAADEILIDELIRAATGVQRGVLKLIVTAGDGQRGYARPGNPQSRRVLSRSALPEWPTQAWKEGVRVTGLGLRMANQPALAGVKHLNRLEQVLARAQLPADCDEGLLCNEQGWLQCGIMSNLFWYADGSWHTPVVEAAGVAGVTREKLMQLSGLSVRESRNDPMRVQAEAERLFLCNALIGIWPVARWDERRYDTGRDEAIGLNALRHALNHPLLRESM